MVEPTRDPGPKQYNLSLGSQKGDMCKVQQRNQRLPLIHRLHKPTKKNRHFHIITRTYYFVLYNLQIRG